MVCYVVFGEVFREVSYEVFVDVGFAAISRLFFVLFISSVRHFCLRSWLVFAARSLYGSKSEILLDLCGNHFFAPKETFFATLIYYDSKSGFGELASRIFFIVWETPNTVLIFQLIMVRIRPYSYIRGD
jgi:hypothetical protein